MRFQQGEEKQLFYTKLRRSKKGVGSVIGAVFIVLIILSGFTFYEVSLLNMNNYTVTNSSIDAEDRNRSNEKLSILSVQITNESKLNITAKNSGSVQSTIIWLGIFNQSVTPENQGFFSISQSFSIGETQSFLSPFQVTPDQKYTVQLVTKDGNVFVYTLYPANQVTLDLSLIVAPPTVYQSNNITLLLTVTNNNTEGMFAENITVSIAAVPSTLTSVLSAPSSLTINSLAPGSSTFFTWTYGATEIGTVLFEATYNQAPQGVLATASVVILEAPTANQAQVTITGTSATTPYHPNNWDTLGGTSHVSGSVQDLSANDSATLAFASYYTGTLDNINGFVTSSSSDVDGNPNTGALDNFAGMQLGPDGSQATLTEALTSNPTGYFGNPAATGSSYTSISSNRMYGGVFTSGSLAASVYNITFYGRSSSGTVNVKAVICDSAGNILTNGISNPLSVTTTAAWCTLTFSVPPTINPNTSYWLMIVSSANSIRLYYSSSSGGSGKLDASNSYASPTNPTDASSNAYQYRIYANTSSINTYKLDFETQWTGINPDMQNNELGIYLSSQSGSENIVVDAWVSGAWQNLFTGLSTGWNNISITSYLTSSTFALRFRDSAPTDTTEDSWNIDVALIHQTSQNDQYTNAVEFIGLSNTNTWASLAWRITSQFDSSNVNVTIQFYNFTLGTYVTSGSGYATFLSVADTSNLQSSTLALNCADFKNATGAWKIKITAVKDTSDPFNMSFDWVEIQPTYESSGNTLSYGTLQNYTVTSTSIDGAPTPYVYLSLYANGSSISLQNAETNVTITNPAWVQLDSNGIYYFTLQSTSTSQESFTVFASVGTTVGQKNVVQESQ